MKRFTDTVGNYMPLKDYTDTELYKLLDKNESTEPMILACICSEILRRENRCDINKIKSLLDEICTYAKYDWIERCDNLKKEIESELEKL